jgi:hypothetical protein
MITITTYQELSDFVAAFAEDNLNMLVLWSRGGMGKSEEVRHALADCDVVHIGGHVTPLGLYAKLHEGRDRKVVFDEIDGLLSDTKHVGLLKQLCETRERKRINWVSTDRRAEEIDSGRGYFYTTSHVLMLCNSFKAVGANVAALQTRATVVQFAPTSSEILEKIKTFATDTDIVVFLEQFHEAIPDFSLRTYRLVEGLKRSGLDWQRYALDETNTQPKAKEIADLIVRFRTDDERIKHYSGSRRDYYNWKSQAQAYLRRRELVSVDEAA